MRPSRTAEPRLPRALWLRAWWPDGNPLRRTSDRVEAAIIAAALLLFLAGAPLLAVFAWHWADAAALRVQQRQYSSWHQVSAVLLATARPVVDIGYGGVTGSEVRARWTAPDGAVRTGQVPAPATRPGGQHGAHLGGSVRRADRPAAARRPDHRSGRAGQRAGHDHPGHRARSAPSRWPGTPWTGAVWRTGRPTGGPPGRAGTAAGEPGTSLVQAGTGRLVIALLTTTTGHGACRRQARATGPMPSGVQRVALPSTSRSAPAA